VTLASAIAAFAAAPLSGAETARAVARLSALDWLAVARAGVDEPVAQIVRRTAVDDGGSAQATVFGTDIRLPAGVAALVNGTTSHALDYDDTHFAHIGHPSTVIFPAAFAAGEAAGATLAEVIDAALVGMEASVRIGVWLGRGHYQIGFHQTATSGAFGAALAAARLLGGDAAMMEAALGLTATRAAGLKAQFGTMGKPYNAGQAAAAGFDCARLACAGMTTDSAALDGPYGFGATHHGVADPAALDGLGEHWLFEGVSHKFHACCHGLHAALEALASADIAGAEVARVSVATHPRWLSVCNQPAPETGLGAKFSYRTALALRLAGQDTAALATWSDALAVAPAVTALRDRMEIAGDDALGEMHARLTITRKDGGQVDAFHDLDAALPLADRAARVTAKARALIGQDLAGEAAALLSGDAPVARFTALFNR
jgi:2-methylcitrate dehydratase PrpD